MQLGDFSAWITMDGQQLAEYGVEHSADGKSATCWVPSDIDRNFVICWKSETRTLNVSGRLRVDGVKCRGGLLHAKPTGRNRGRTAYNNIMKMSGIHTSSTTERPFAFAKQQLTDDDAFLAAYVPTELGSINLTLTEVTITGYSPYYPTTNMFPETLKVHERSKKGVEHGVKLGKEVRVHKAKSSINAKKIRKLVNFTFKYRPIELLRANGIAPLVHVRREISLNQDDILDLTGDAYHEDSVDDAARIRALEEELRVLKEKAGIRQPKAEPRVKQEVKRERHLVQLGEVIDLT